MLVDKFAGFCVLNTVFLTNGERELFINDCTVLLRSRFELIKSILFLSQRKFFKMTIDLYYLPASAPCSSVRLLAGSIGVELNLKFTNLMEGEHLTPEYLKVNAIEIPLQFGALCFDLEQCQDSL